VSPGAVQDLRIGIGDQDSPPDRAEVALIRQADPGVRAAGAARVVLKGRGRRRARDDLCRLPGMLPGQLELRFSERDRDADLVVG
jgi:hypothetical protein